VREGRKVDLVVVELCRRLKQASLEKANVGGTGDQGAKDNRVDRVSASSASDALQHRCDMLAVRARFGGILRAVEASPARGNQRSTQHCCLLSGYTVQAEMIRWLSNRSQAHPLSDYKAIDTPKRQREQ
jgi:hypothetical protein